MLKKKKRKRKKVELPCGILKQLKSRTVITLDFALLHDSIMRLGEEERRRETKRDTKGEKNPLCPPEVDKCM